MDQLSLDQPNSPLAAVLSAADNSARGELNAVDSSRRRVSLLDLPDELLAEIISLLYRHGPPIPSDLSATGVFACRRLAQIARQLLLVMRSAERSVEGELQVTQLLARIVEPHSNVACRLRRLTVRLARIPPLLACEAISALTNLTHLTLAFGGVWACLSTFSEMFKCLASLQFLGLTGWPTNQYRGFDLSQAAPTLQTLRLDLDWYLDRILANPPPSLSHIIFDGEDFSGHPRLWQDLERVTVEPVKGYIDDAYNFWDDLIRESEATTPFPRLRHLRLAVDRVGDEMFFYDLPILSIMTALSLSHLEQFELKFVVHFGWIPADITIPSVRTLILHGTCDTEKNYNLEYLLDQLDQLDQLFHFFPAVTALRLRGFMYADNTPEPAHMFWPPTAIPDPLRPILSYFERTTLLRFYCTTEDGCREMRYSRASRKDKFEGELWLLE